MALMLSGMPSGLGAAAEEADWTRGADRVAEETAVAWRGRRELERLRAKRRRRVVGGGGIRRRPVVGPRVSTSIGYVRGLGFAQQETERTARHQ